MKRSIREKKLSVKIALFIFILLGLAFFLLLTFSFNSIMNIEKNKFENELINVSKTIQKNGIKKVQSRIIRDILYIPHSSDEIYYEGLYKFSDISKYDFLSINEKVIDNIKFDGYDLLVYRINGDNGSMFLTKNILYVGETFKRISIVGIIILFCLSILVYLVSLRLSRIAMEPLYDANNRLKEYNHNIAHELKTPLSVIKSNLELLELSGSNELVLSSIDEVNLMKGVVDSLLFLSENISLKKEKDVDLKKIIRAAIYSNNFPQSRIKIIDKRSEKRIILSYDEKLLDRLLKNIIENGLKYSPSKSKVKIIISDKNLEIVNDIKEKVAIEDTDKLFDVFYQGENSRSSEGYGLGLALAKKIVTSFGWSINLNLINEKFVVLIKF